MNRRGFLARLVSTGFGLAAGTAVAVKAATPDEINAVQRLPFMLSPMDGRYVWIDRMVIKDLRDRLDVTNWSGEQKYIDGVLDFGLEVHFRGSGVPELSQLLYKNLGHVGRFG